MEERDILETEKIKASQTVGPPAPRPRSTLVYLAGKRSGKKDEEGDAGKWGCAAGWEGYLLAASGLSVTHGQINSFSTLLLPAHGRPGFTARV